MTPRKSCAESRKCLRCSTTWSRWLGREGSHRGVAEAWVSGWGKGRAWVCGRGLRRTLRSLGGAWTEPGV